MNPKRLLFLCFAVAVLAGAGGHAFAQEDQDNQPHIQPRKEEKQKRPAKPSATPQAAQPDEQSPDAQPPDIPLPNAQPAGQPQGESSSKDSQIDLTAGPPRGSNVAPSPANEPRYDPHRAEKDIEVGNYYLKQKNYRAALERFHDALIYKPDDAQATYGLAVTQEKVDLFSQAYNSYSKYLELLPEGPDAKEAQEGLKRMESHLSPEAIQSNVAAMAAEDLARGERELSTNEYAAARQSFEHAMRLAPDNPVISFRMAQSLEGLQQPDAARMYYKKYLELQPNGPLARDAKKNISRINDTIGN